jgi:cytochrome c5
MEREITMRWNRFALGILTLGMVSGLAVAAQQNSASTSPSHGNGAVEKQADKQQENGQRAFDQHCARCHNAPDSFSPRISGTIVRHMRVRASLSEQEEKDLLRFLNP